jgi:hypothetical protein
LAGLDEPPQRAARADQVVLADDLVEGARAQELGQRGRLAQALGDGVVKE